MSRDKEYEELICELDPLNACGYTATEIEEMLGDRWPAAKVAFEKYQSEFVRW